MSMQEQYNDAMNYGILINTVREGEYRFDYVVYQNKVMAFTKHNGEVKEIKIVHHY